MKEHYFKETSIDKIAAKMLSDLKKKVKVHELKYIPEESALLVLDMQKYFLDETSHAFVPGAEAVVRNINKLLNYYSEKKYTVVFTKHLNNELDAGLMGKWWKELITVENPLVEITEKLDTTKGIIINKSQYDAFYKTELKKFLAEKNIKQLVITGVMTHLCCETTARSGFVNGFDVFFTIDGTATYNINYHYASLLNLAHGFAVPVLVKQLIP